MPRVSRHSKLPEQKKPFGIDLYDLPRHMAAAALNLDKTVSDAERLDAYKEQEKKEFEEQFRYWLRNDIRLRPEFRQKTPWLKNKEANPPDGFNRDLPNLLHLPGVYDYLSREHDDYHRFVEHLKQLKFKGPTNDKEALEYFKYIICKVPATGAYPDDANWFALHEAYDPKSFFVAYPPIYPAAKPPKPSKKPPAKPKEPSRSLLSRLNLFGSRSDTVTTSTHQIDRGMNIRRSRPSVEDPFLKATSELSPPETIRAVSKFEDVKTKVEPGAPVDLKATSELSAPETLRAVEDVKTKVEPGAPVEEEQFFDAPEIKDEPNRPGADFPLDGTPMETQLRVERDKPSSEDNAAGAIMPERRSRRIAKKPPENAGLVFVKAKPRQKKVIAEPDGFTGTSF